MTQTEKVMGDYCFKSMRSCRTLQSVGIHQVINDQPHNNNRSRTFFNGVYRTELARERQTLNFGLSELRIQLSFR